MTDKEVLEYILSRCETTTSAISKTVAISHGKLWRVRNYGGVFNVAEIECLVEYLKIKTNLTDTFIKKIMPNRYKSQRQFFEKYINHGEFKILLEKAEIRTNDIGRWKNGSNVPNCLTMK